MAKFHSIILPFSVSFLVVKPLYRTRLRALHVKHVRSNLYEGPCIVLRREEPLFGSIFSLTPTKIGHFSIRYILDIYGSFLVVKLLYRTRLRAFHVKHFISSLYECCSYTFRRGESIFGSIFSLAFAKKGHFRQPFFWLFWDLFARKTARSDETRTTSCQTR
jgi:hypothetical protein